VSKANPWPKLVRGSISRQALLLCGAGSRDGHGSGVLYALSIERAADRPARGDAQDAAALSVRARGVDWTAGGGRAVQGDEARGGAALGCDRAGGAVGGDGLCHGGACMDETTEGFYRHFGFVRLEGVERVLVLAIIPYLSRLTHETQVAIAPQTREAP
jgi:hypothetical protein